MPVKELRTYEFWGHAATFLVEIYKSTSGANKGNFLDVGSAHGYFSGWFNAARLRLQGSDDELSKVRAGWRARSAWRCLASRLSPLASRLSPLASRLLSLSSRSALRQAFFYAALKDDSSEQREWYLGIKSKMERLIVQRKIVAGESMDKSATEIFLQHIKELSAAFARAGTEEAAARKLGIKTLWRACGRSGEPAALALGNMQWQQLFTCASIESPQSKPSKLKYILFPAGACRYSDWTLDFGDNLVYQSRANNHQMVYAPGASPPLASRLSLASRLASRLSPLAHVRDAHQAAESLAPVV